MGRGDPSHAVFRAAQAGDHRARAQVVERYLPLARSLALRFRGRSEPLDDLIQVASLGLMSAIGRYDADRGLAFSSYAVPTILGELRRHFRDRTWSVHMPRRLQEQSAQITKFSDALSSRLGRSPTVAELATEAGMSEEDVLGALLAASAYRSASLDKPITGDEDTLAGLFGYEDGGYAEIEARAVLDSAAAASLTERQGRVLRLHVEEDLTQCEIAERVGISQMQVSRDLRVARAVLRSAFSNP